MKAMILAAGRGERMRPLTDTTPKPLLKIAGQCLIEYHIQALVKAGVTDLVINHAWLGEQIEQLLGDGRHYGAHIQYSPEVTALETAGGIINALELLGEQPFIAVNGDVFSDYSFIDLAKLNITQPAHLVMVNNPPHHPQGDFYYRNNQVLLQTDDPSQNRYTFSGIGVYKPVFFHGLAPGKRALAPLLRDAMDRNRVSGEYYPGLWLDIGTAERLHELNRELSE